MTRRLSIFRICGAAALALALVSSPGRAADGPLGIAVAAMPEAGAGTCFAADAAEGLACAQRKCASEAAVEPADCEPVLWCFPSLYSADVVVMTAEQFVYHQYLCGAQSREELVVLARAKCGGPEASNAMECVIGQAWDPNGEPLTIEDEIRPAGAAR